MAAPGNNRGPVTLVNVANSGRIATPTKPVPTMARPRASEEVTSNPAMLARYLSELESKLDELARLTAANVFGSGVLIRNITMSGAASTLIEHRMRRAYTGWTLMRVQSSSATPPRVYEQALPTGRDAAQWLNLNADQACTIDVLVT